MGLIVVDFCSFISGNSKSNSDKKRFEHEGRPEGSEGVSYAANQGRVPGSGDSKCKGPEERAHGRGQQEGHCSQSSE